MRLLTLALSLLTSSVALGQPLTMSVPPYGQYGIVTGRAINITANALPTGVQLYIFVPDLGWFSKPSCGPIPVGPDGTWSATYALGNLDALATRFAAYMVLLPNAAQLPCVLGTTEIPASIEQAALAKVTVLRPDPAPRTLRFSGLDWVVKAPPAPVFPGPNLFDGNNASVDAQGRLHLAVRRCGNRYCTAEVFSKDMLGYGTYRVTLDSPVDNLDPNVVLGMFTWSENGAFANRELDFEFSRWGNASDPNNAQFVVQPYTLPNHLVRYRMPSSPNSVHTMRWEPASVSFESIAGTEIASPPVGQFTFNGPGVPPVGETQFHLNLYLNNGNAPANGQDAEIIIRRFEYTPSGGTASLGATLVNVPSTANTGSIPVIATAGCNWTATGFPDWISISGGVTGSGNGVIAYQVAANAGVSRVGGIRLSGINCNVAPGAQELSVTQAGTVACVYGLSKYSEVLPFGSLLAIFPPPPLETTVVVAPNAPGCAWNAVSNASWITVAPPASGLGVGPVLLTIGTNNSPVSRTGTVDIAGQIFTVTQRGTTPLVGLRFVPVTPCRIADTRIGGAPFGAPFLAAGSTREFPIPASGCGIPAQAQAYSLNLTAVPRGPLPYVTLWPTGQQQPLVSTLNSFEGAILANAAIVPAGANGSINAFASAATDLVLDINGYFVPNAPDGLAFFPLQTPCRVMDTRVGSGRIGPFGPPSLTAANPRRDMVVQGSGCPVSLNARAYALNVTVVPRGSLTYLTVWPLGPERPTVSTLNSFDGRVLANAAIVPASPPGGVSIYAALAANAEVDVIIDINGYFGPPAPGSLLFYPVTPCRVVDTRTNLIPFGGPPLRSGETRSFPMELGACSIPIGAAAYSLNATVVPNGSLNYLTLWPASTGRPLVSTLNSFDGRIVANAAIVPLVFGGAIGAFVSLSPENGTTDLIMDINGYFAQ